MHCHVCEICIHCHVFFVECHVCDKLDSLLSQSKEVPSEYKSELQGLADGAAANGCPKCGNYSTRSIVMSNLPSDLQDVLLILLREMNPTLAAELRKEQAGGMQW